MRILLAIHLPAESRIHILVGLVRRKSLLSQVWNTTSVRAIIPDDVGIHFSASLVPTVGARYSYNFDDLTRGNDAGFHMSKTLSLRVGEEAGYTVDFIRGWYFGPGKDATFNSLIGMGADVDAAFGPINLGYWTSINEKSYNLTWLGTSIGGEWSFRGSGGVLFTMPVK